MRFSYDGVYGRQRMNVFQVIWRRLKEHLLSWIGPGLITGVADDDPSGIATYSQAGAQFGLNMLWTMPLTYPLMATNSIHVCAHRAGGYIPTDCALLRCLASRGCKHS